MIQPLREDDLVQVVGAYRLTASVVATAQLSVPDHLTGGPQTPEDLASALDVEPALLARLLRMLASYGALLVDDEGRYANTGLSAALRSGPMRDMVLGWSALPGVVRAWSGLAAGIRAGVSPFEVVNGTGFHDYLPPCGTRKRRRPTTGRWAPRPKASLTSPRRWTCAAGRPWCASAVATAWSSGHSSSATHPPARSWWTSPTPSRPRRPTSRPWESGIASRSCPTMRGAPSRRETYTSCRPCFAASTTPPPATSSARAGAPRPATLRCTCSRYPCQTGAPQQPNAMMDLTAWVAYGGMDLTVPRWRELFAEAGWNLEDVVPLTAPYSMLNGTAAAAGD